MAEGHRIGVIYAELGMDFEPYTKAQKQLLKDVTSTTLNVEKNFKDLHIKSSAELDLLRLKTENAFQRIAHSSQASANDIIRAEQAKNRELERLNEIQFGSQTSMLSQLKTHWLAASAVIYGAMATIGKGWDMAKAGADFDEQRGLLDNLSRKYKMTADSIVSDMARAAEGQIANVDLMSIALGGLGKGLKPDQLINLADAARVLGDVVGKNATTALKDLTEALETGRTKGLKTYLGTALDLETAFGDLVPKMTAAEKSLAMYNMTMISANKLQAEQVKNVDDAGDKFERLEARWKNLTTEAGRYFKTLAIGIMDTVDFSKGFSAPFDLPIEQDTVTGLHMSGQGASSYGPFIRPRIAEEEKERFKNMRNSSGDADASPYEAENSALKALLETRKNAVKDAKDADREALEGYNAQIQAMERKQAASDKYEKGTYDQAIKDRDALIKIQEDLRKEDEKYTAEKTQAYRAMYKDLKKLGDENFSAEKELLDKQAEGYRKLGIEETLIAEWVAKKEFDLNKQRILDQGTFSEGVSVGLHDLQEKYGKWAGNIAKFGSDAMTDLHSSFSDVFYDGFRGKLDSLSDYWSDFTENLKRKFFRMTADIAAQKIMMMFTSSWASEPKGQGSIEKLLGIDVPILTFAGGGSVPGAWNGRDGFAGDSVPAMLTPGEYVVRRGLAQDPFFGALLRAANEGGGSRGTVAAGANIPGLMGIQGLYDGGIVAPWLPHYGWIGDLVSTFSGGLSDIFGLTKGGNWLPSFTSYIGDLIYGRDQLDVWEMISRVMEPSGLVHGGTRWLGSMGGKDLSQAAGYLGPMIGGYIGGPLGAAAGSNIASEWQVGYATGETNPTHEQMSQMNVEESQHFKRAIIAAVATYLAQEGGEYIKTSDGGVYKAPEGSTYTDSAGQTWLQEPGGQEWAVESASALDATKASLNTAWERAQQMGSDFYTELSKLMDMSGDEMWGKLSSWASDSALGTWENIKNLPDYLWDRIMNFDPYGYVKDRATDIIGNVKFGLAGMSGGSLLDESAISQTMGIGQDDVFVAHNGTGPAGLPYTGFFYGQEGEIVKSRPQSDAERRGSERPIIVQGDIYLDGKVVGQFKKEIKALAEAVIVNRNGRGMSASTQKVYS